MTWHRIASFRDARCEVGDCKPRLKDRDLSIKDQQVRLEEFPNRANRFRRIGGAAIVGSAVPSPVSGRSPDSVRQETGNTGASSHPQAAPDVQISRKNLAIGMRHRLVLEREGQPQSHPNETAFNSSVRSMAYIDTCSLGAVDTQGPHDKIEMAQKVRKFNRFDDFSPTTRALWRPAGSVGLRSSEGGWGSQMSISSEQYQLFPAATQLDGPGAYHPFVLGPTKDSRIRRNTANQSFLGRFRVVGSPMAPHVRPLWHTSCNVVPHDADPSIEPGKQEAE
jgi:hypothetical protein